MKIAMSLEFPCPRSRRVFIDPDSRDQEIYKKKKEIADSVSQSVPYEKDSRRCTYVFTLADHTICVIGAIRRPI